MGISIKDTSYGCSQHIQSVGIYVRVPIGIVRRVIMMILIHVERINNKSKSAFIQFLGQDSVGLLSNTNNATDIRYYGHVVREERVMENDVMLAEMSGIEGLECQ